MCYACLAVVRSIIHGHVNDRRVYGNVETLARQSGNPPSARAQINTQRWKAKDDLLPCLALWLLIFTVADWERWEVAMELGLI